MTSDPAPSRTRLWPWITLGVLLVLAGLGYLGLRAGLAALEREVVRALGPGAEVAVIRVGTTAVEIEGLVLPGGDGWPATESLRAERVRIVPTWRSLLSGPVAIAHIEIEAPYLSMLRTRDGDLRVLPTLLGRRADSAPAAAEAAAPSSAGRGVEIGEIHLARGTLDFHDATVARTPWRVRLTELDATLGDVSVPALAERMPFELRGVLDGPQRDGRIALAGWLVASSRDLSLQADLAGIDLLALEPYLIEAAKARLEHGTLDMKLSARVEAKQLHAPGHLVLSNLGFAHGGRPQALVLGVPRDVLLAALQAEGGRLALDFSLDGRVDDPHFSLNETFAVRVGVALAKELGVGVGGLVEGTLGLGLEGLGGAGKAAGGIGSALRKLIPGK